MQKYDSRQKKGYCNFWYYIVLCLFSVFGILVQWKILHHAKKRKWSRRLLKWNFKWERRVTGRSFFITFRVRRWRERHKTKKECHNVWRKLKRQCMSNKVIKGRVRLKNLYTTPLPKEPKCDVQNILKKKVLQSITPESTQGVRL